MSKRIRPNVSAAVAKLADMDLKALREEWERRYGAAPRHRSVDLLRRVLAWRLQADVHGGFDAVTLKLITRDNSAMTIAAPPGMRLAREYAGRVHEAVVVESGVVYQGKTYGSLSEVARLITGKRWNGPRFFGLREPKLR